MPSVLINTTCSCLLTSKELICSRNSSSYINAYGKEDMCCTTKWCYDPLCFVKFKWGENVLDHEWLCSLMPGKIISK